MTRERARRGWVVLASTTGMTNDSAPTWARWMYLSRGTKPRDVPDACGWTPHLSMAKVVRAEVAAALVLRLEDDESFRRLYPDGALVRRVVLVPEGWTR